MLDGVFCVMERGRSSPRIKVPEMRELERPRFISSQSLNPTPHFNTPIRVNLYHHNFSGSRKDFRQGCYHHLMGDYEGGFAVFSLFQPLMQSFQLFFFVRWSPKE